MYEPPKTAWTLRLVYATKTPVQLPGESSASILHIEEWKWVVDSDADHVHLLIELLAELPFGTSQVPLISDPTLVEDLHVTLSAVEQALADSDPRDALDQLLEFENLAIDACIAVAPRRAVPDGIGTGIAQTVENPACCKLLVDAEYLGFKYGIFTPVR